MKCLKFAAAFALCLAMGQAFAQTCGAPTALTAAGVSNVNGCTPSTNTVGLVCSFNNNPSPDTIFSFTLGAGFTATTITLTNVTGSPFQPQMILQQACGSTDECLVTGNAASVGGGATLTLTGQAAGAYFLIVDGTSTSSATDCGTFSLAVDGTLPVQLQKFSVD
jgi:hypothetical protein